MTVLLVLTGAMLLVSGAVKVRSGARGRIGIQPLSLLELLCGFLWCGAAALGLGGTPTALWLVPAGIFLVIASSVLFSTRMNAYLRRRAESEARRLEAYVKYLHAAQEPPETDD